MRVEPSACLSDHAIRAPLRGSPKTDCKRRSERSSPAGPIPADHGDHVAAVLAGSGRDGRHRPGATGRKGQGGSGRVPLCRHPSRARFRRQGRRDLPGTFNQVRIPVTAVICPPHLEQGAALNQIRRKRWPQSLHLNQNLGVRLAFISEYLRPGSRRPVRSSRRGIDRESGRCRIRLLPAARRWGRWNRCSGYRRGR